VAKGHLARPPQLGCRCAGSCGGATFGAALEMDSVYDQDILQKKREEMWHLDWLAETINGLLSRIRDQEIYHAEVFTDLLKEEDTSS